MQYFDAHHIVCTTRPAQIFNVKELAWSTCYYYYCVRSDVCGLYIQSNCEVLPIQDQLCGSFKYFWLLGWGGFQHLVNYGILRMWSAEFRGDYVTWCVGTHDPWVRQFSSLWCFFCFHHNSWLVLLLLEKITIHYWLTDCAITTTSMVLRWMGSIVWYAFGSIPSWDSSQICNSLQAEKEHKLNHVR